MSPVLHQAMEQYGIVQIENLFTRDCLDAWNDALDPIFARHSPELRSYVGIQDLFRLGILKECLNADILNLFSHFMQDPALYHCHVFETTAGQKISHTRGNLLNGWHRDSDVTQSCPTTNDSLSLFIHLTEVHRENGPFEIIPSSFHGNLPKRSPSLQMLGGIGTSYLWNRKLYHRAAPNFSKSRRRILKISMHPKAASASNDCDKEFQDLSTHLKFLFKSKSPLIFHRLVPNADMTITNWTLLKSKFLGRFRAYRL